MDRRNFFKLVGTASGGALTGACGNSARELIPLLVPEQQIVPGIEEWRPSVCRACGSGCGTIVRVMQSERKIILDGETVRQPIAAIKKIEGNPLDPVSGGRLCARGQAAVQSLYHPDRLRGPQKRTGARGSAQFEDVSWEEALTEAATLLSEAVENNPRGIVYLTGPEAGTRAVTIDRFLRAIGAEPASTTGLSDFSIERKASELLFGWRGLPVYEIQDATYVLSVGADFLGGWTSPVFYARRFGHMRQGRPALRGTLVQAESRFSQTGWSADRWLPVRPGGEQAFALAIGHFLVKEHDAPGANDVPPTFRQTYEAIDPERAAEICGIELRKIRRVAGELAEATNPLVIGGASIVQTNSLAATVAANGLNLLLANVGKKGGIMPPAEPLSETIAESGAAFRNSSERLESAEVVLLDGANPAYTNPACVEQLASAKLVLSFSRFVDDSAAYADLILPDHDPLESAAAVVPAVTPQPSLTGTRAFVQPLYETRATEGVLAELAERAGKPISTESPDDAFRGVFEAQKLDADWSDVQEFARYCERQGGWWMEAADAQQPPSVTVSVEASASLETAEFTGEEDAYPFYFQPYPSLQFSDGDGSHLPWLQQTPDPTSSAMWGLPVEMDPGSAAKLAVSNGQIVRIVSPVGQIEAPVYVNPAAIPGVVSMAIGQGHTHYGRYASGRGANPLAIVASARESGTGVPAFGATRVRLEKVSDRRGLVQFSSADREPHPVRL